MSEPLQPIKIGINGRFLAAKRTGVQRAAYNLIRSILDLDHFNDYYLFTSANQVNNPDWNYPNVTVIPCGIKEGENFRNHVWEQFVLPRLLKKHKIDILHSPANLSPLFYSGKSIVHIHDLCFVVNPSWFSFTFRTAYKLVIPRLAKKATRVITNSNNSRNDLFQFCKLDARKVSQVYWAVDDVFLEKYEKDPAESWDLQDYILYVGSLEPRKNIETLLKSYEILREKNPHITSKLVLIGGESPLFAEVRLKAKRYIDDVLFKGFVTDLSLRDFYRHSKLFVYPSLYEGFGLPPLEAMASGTPVVTSHTSSLPEVVGTAALMVNPYDADEIANAMAELLSNATLREKMIEDGLKRVQYFNWRKVALNTLTVYYEVYKEGQDRSSNPYLPIGLWRYLKGLSKSNSYPVQ